jgi:hypothetical protein
MLVVREYLGDLGIDWVTVLEGIIANKVMDKDWIWMVQVAAVVYWCGYCYEP